MEHSIVIKKEDPFSPDAKLMMDLLWEEIQARYGFKAPNPIDQSGFAVAGAGFWVARRQDTPVGSIALTPLPPNEAEMDVMYVAPASRGTGVAQQLMQVAEQHAKENGFTLIKLRAGMPQPEALRFYEKAGFKRIPAFGKWLFDETAICFAKEV
jgi:GNAT superfamily N-acetyltransferase